MPLVLSLLVALFSFNALAYNVTAHAGDTVTDGVESVSVMAYNVENLFDTEHDEGKDDYTYLPLTMKQSREHKNRCNQMRSDQWRAECLHLDWSEKTVAAKMRNIAVVVKSINNGRGPDVLLLEEVENIKILRRLNNEYLKELGYKTVVLIEGHDDRGIDQAILSRLPLKNEPENFAIPLNGGGNNHGRKEPSRTRGILKVTLQLPDGKGLTVFGVHFPAGGGAHGLRVKALNFLNKVRNQVVPSDEMAVVGGDFNINVREDDQFDMYGRGFPNWLVSHKVGCATCLGSSYYHKEQSWSFLDAIAATDNMDENDGSAPWYFDSRAVQIASYSDSQIDHRGLPISFNPQTGVGISDHFPVFTVIRKR